MNVKTLYTLFKRIRIPKRRLIGAINKYSGSKNELRKITWRNGITHQALWHWLGEGKKFRSFRERLHRIVAERGGITHRKS